MTGGVSFVRRADAEELTFASAGLCHATTTQRPLHIDPTVITTELLVATPSTRTIAVLPIQDSTVRAWPRRVNLRQAIDDLAVKELP